MPVTMLREDTVSMVLKYESPVLRYIEETTSHITPLGNDEAPTSNPEPKPLSSAKSAKLAPSAESSNNGLETPSILKQILDYIRSVVREFFRRLLH